MATKKRSNRGGLRRAVQEDDLTEEQWELVDFIEEIGPKISRVYIWRVPKFGDHEYLDRVEVSVLKEGAEEFLRETYGAPCKYFLRFKGSDGLWKFSKTVNVGSLDKQLFLDSLSTSQTRSQTSGQTAADTEFRRELALIQQRQHETNLKLIENLGKQTGPDPSAMLTSVVTAVTALRQSTGPNGEFDLKKFREIVGVVNDLRSDNNGAGKEENLYTVVKDLGNKVVDTVAAFRQPAALPPAQIEPAAAVAPPPGNGGARPMPSIQDWLKIQIHYLKQKALAGKDPESWIDYVLDNEEEPGCAAIVYAIKQKVTFDQLLQFDAEIANNPTLTVWFKTLYDGLSSEINNPVDTTGGTGNAGDPRSNEKPGNTGSDRPPSAEPGAATT